MHRARKRESRGWPIVAGCTAVSAAVAAAAIARHGRGEDGVRCALRTTAYATFVPFIAAISSEPLARQIDHPASTWLARRARWFGLGAGVSHCVIHAGLIAALVRVHEGGGTGLRMESVPGAPGYLALGVLVRRWAGDQTATNVHRLAEDYVLGVFTAAILHGYLTKGRRWQVYAPLGGCVAGAWAIRLAER
jgi:hypothetical protein